MQNKPLHFTFHLIDQQIQCNILTEQTKRITVRGLHIHQISPRLTLIAFILALIMYGIKFDAFFRVNALSGPEGEVQDNELKLQGESALPQGSCVDINIAVYSFSLPITLGNTYLGCESLYSTNSPNKSLFLYIVSGTNYLCRIKHKTILKQNGENIALI